MPDPYTPETVDLLAQAEFGDDHREGGVGRIEGAPIPWAGALSMVRDAYRARAIAGLDALAAAGLLVKPDGEDLSPGFDFARRLREPVLRAQLLTALDLPDDGKTSLTEYVNRLIAERAEARAKLARCREDRDEYGGQAVAAEADRDAMRPVVDAAKATERGC